MIWCAEHQMPKVAEMNGEAICREVLNYRRPDDSPCSMAEALLIVTENGEWPPAAIQAIAAELDEIMDLALDQSAFKGPGQAEQGILDALASAGREC